jgi:hypothetical protein
VGRSQFVVHVGDERADAVRAAVRRQDPVRDVDDPAVGLAPAARVRPGRETVALGDFDGWQQQSARAVGTAETKAEDLGEAAHRPALDLGDAEGSVRVADPVCREQHRKCEDGDDRKWPGGGTHSVSPVSNGKSACAQASFCRMSRKKRRSSR